MIQVTVPIYYKQTKKKTVLLGLNWYRNVHYIVNNNVKKFLRSVVKDDIDGAHIYEGTIHVHYRIYLKRRGSDGGNVRSVIEKYVLDAVKDAGYISEDNADIVVTDSAEYHYDKKFPRAEITLYDKVSDKEEMTNTLLNLILK
jgi:hypothetical protein